MVLGLLLAAAGGGSSGFGGGGGRGGGFGGGGGGGFGGGYGGGGTVSTAGVAVFFAIVVFLVVLVAFGSLLAGWRYRVKRRRRVAAVRLASAEAAEDDPRFAAAAVEPAAADLFRAIQAAWSANDVGTLDRLVGADLMVEWRRRLGDFDRRGWHNTVDVLDGPEIEYVGLVNREGDAEDRVVVRLTATLRDVVRTGDGAVLTRTGAPSEMTALCEYWTLAKADGAGWRVVSIEQRAEGDHNLDAPIVASPWSDDGRLRDAALIEGATAEAPPASFATADIADLDFDGDARAQALDLSLADPRFAPDVLEAAARGIVAAWVEAVDGADDALLAVATPEAAEALLHPAGPSSRRVVRGGTVERLAIERLDASPEPARMHVAVGVRGRVYVEDRDTAALLAGSPGSETTLALGWTVALSGDGAAPWRLVAVTTA